MKLRVFCKGCFILAVSFGQYRCKDGNYKTVEWFATSGGDGIFYATARDVTERMVNDQ